MTRLRVLPGWRMRVMASVLLALGCAYAGPSIARAAPQPTVVSIQFDDGNADVYQWISSLSNHGFPATFYVNSGTIGTTGHLTWPQLTALAQAGNDIGSHTIDHVALKKLKLADARLQVFQDRVNLASHSLQPESFAYPYGDYNSTVANQVVQYCAVHCQRTDTV